MHTKPQISVERYFYENLSQPSIHTAHIPLWFFTTLFLYKIDTLDQNHGENSSQEEEGVLSGAWTLGPANAVKFRKFFLNFESTICKKINLVFYV